MPQSRQTLLSQAKGSVWVPCLGENSFGDFNSILHALPRLRKAPKLLYRRYEQKTKWCTYINTLIGDALDRLRPFFAVRPHSLPVFLGLFVGSLFEERPQGLTSSPFCFSFLQARGLTSLTFSYCLF